VGGARHPSGKGEGGTGKEAQSGQPSLVLSGRPRRSLLDCIAGSLRRTSRWSRASGPLLRRARPGDRQSRRTGLTIRAGLGLVLVLALGAALLLALTPSADSAAARTRDWMAAHRAGPPLTTPPARIVATLIATEDHRFYQHHGLDLLAVGRAAGGLVTGRDTGGSTIEVQLAKLLYTGGRDGLADQIEQAAVAVKLDLTYTKTQILLMYLNSEYFGHGFYGVNAAARGYFDIAPQDVTWGQAAMLVGLLKAPSYDDPFRHPDRALGRRGEVVDRLLKVGVLTAAQATAIKGTPLQLTTSGSGIAPVGP
jgi:hypothetical protein